MWRLILIIAGMVAGVVEPAWGGGFFGIQEWIHPIEPAVRMRGGPGNLADLRLAHKVSAYFVVAGVYVHDDGYVLVADGDDEHYYRLPASGVGIGTLPAYQVPMRDYLLGYSLWWIFPLGIPLYFMVQGVRGRWKRRFPDAVPRVTVEAGEATFENFNFARAGFWTLGPRRRIRFSCRLESILKASIRLDAMGRRWLEVEMVEGKLVSACNSQEMIRVGGVLADAAARNLGAGAVAR